MIRVYILLSAVLFACKKPSNVEGQPLFEKGVSQGKVSTKLEEASGLVASISNPGYLWTINDSGNPAEVFLLDEKAEIVMTCKLEKIKNRDWEDIALGPADEAGRSYLYVGEIGDNEAKYKYKYLYKFVEPTFEDDKKMSIDKIDTIVITLPDGRRDMESFTIDQTSGDMYFVSKREKEVNVYVVPAHLQQTDTLVPEKILSLPFHNVVAADISPDGNEWLIKTYDEILYWQRSDSLSIIEMLKKKPIKLPYKPEPQGESVAWSRDAKGYFTVSESKDGEKAKLYYYKRH